MRKMNKILVSAAVCGILSVTLGTGVSAEYLPSFVTGITTTAEDITDEITEIPEESIIDTEETTTSSEIVSETAMPVIDIIGGDTAGELAEKTDDDDIDDFAEEDYYDPALKGNAHLLRTLPTKMWCVSS